jgi:hypothetical protein
MSNIDCCVNKFNVKAWPAQANIRAQRSANSVSAVWQLDGVALIGALHNAVEVLEQAEVCRRQREV